MGQIVGCLEGMAEACRALDFPIVSRQRLALQREQGDRRRQRHPAHPRDRRRRPARGLDARPSASPSRAPGDVIVAIGDRRGHLGQSLWLREIHGREDGAGRRRRSTSPPSARPASSSAPPIAGGAITACHDVSDGGLAVALAEMALAGNVGALINRPDAVRRGRLFRRGPGRLRRHRLRQLPARPSSPAPMPPGSRSRRSAGPPASRLIFELPDGDHAVALAELRAAHEGFFPALMGDSLPPA